MSNKKADENISLSAKSEEAKLTMLLAIKAKCWDCMGYYTDGKIDCENFECPLYNWMPYAEYQPLTPWLKYNPKRVGKITWEASKRKMTDEQRAALKKRMKKMQKAMKRKREKEK